MKFRERIYQTRHAPHVEGHVQSCFTLSLVHFDLVTLDWKVPLGNRHVTSSHQSGWKENGQLYKKKRSKVAPCVTPIIKQVLLGAMHRTAVTSFILWHHRNYVVKPQQLTDIMYMVKACFSVNCWHVFLFSFWCCRRGTCKTPSRYLWFI